MTFYDDHTMAIESYRLGQGHRQRGEWSYEDGILSVEMPELQNRDKVTWINRHKISLTQAGKKYILERR